MTRRYSRLHWRSVATACSSRAPYKAPAVAPTAMRNADASLVVEQPFDPRWWGQFEDPVLDELESRALAANHDVRIAVARVDQARAIFDDVRLDRYPTAIVGCERRQAKPGDSRLLGRPRERSPPIAPASTRSGSSTCSGGSATRCARRPPTADSFAAAVDDVRVSVASEVARNYFELRGLQQRLAVAERSLANQQETLRLTRVRRDAGFGEEQDVASAGARVAAIEASMPPIRSAIALREHRLAVLIATRPGALDVDLAPRPYPALAKALAIGEPDSLLRRRPDVRAAERRLAASTANEAVAAADLYPRITISGFLGLLAGRGNIFNVADTRAWAVTPALSWAAFDLGSARARLRGVEGVTREVVAEFEQVVLRALEETENALVNYREDQQRLVKLAEQARESSRAAAIARVRYREGAADFLALLDAERTELQAEDAVAEAEAGVFTSVIAVYKALGGIPAS